MQFSLESVLPQRAGYALSNALSPASRPPLRILLVEDNYGDELLTRKAVAASRLPHAISCVQRGDRVMPYLLDCLYDPAKSLPELLMLDLGLPNSDGFEILSEISASPAAIRAIPLVILTGYEDFTYVCKNYDLCFLAYLPKPCDPSVIARLLATLQRFTGETLVN